MRSRGGVYEKPRGLLRDRFLNCTGERERGKSMMKKVELFSVFVAEGFEEKKKR